MTIDPHRLGATPGPAIAAEEMGEPVPTPPEGELVSSWLPTRKWFAAQTTLLAGLLVFYATHGWHFDEHTTVPTITFIAEAVVAYLVPNADTPAGVPLK